MAKYRVNEFGAIIFEESEERKQQKQQESREQLEKRVQELEGTVKKLLQAMESPKKD